jgi:hypothetical protein
MIWDMNRLRYTRALRTGRSESIQFCSINEADVRLSLF